MAATPAALAGQLAVTTPVPSDTAPPSIQAKLVVLRGQRINQEYPLYPGRNMLGRFADRPVDIDLGAQEAEGQIWSSRQHALVTFDKNVLVVEDLNSLNGTWVNAVRLIPGTKRALQPNDIIQIGTVQLRLVIQ
ncbi:MAG: FHA domain-containing protein [Gemmataceae bacterium]